MRGERGASAVLVGLLLVPLVGATALAVDVGALYAERAQLQNGADAAALAVAAACAKNEVTCSGAALSLAEPFVTGNASIPSGPTTNAPTVDTGANRVTVTAENEVSHPFAAVLIGDAASLVPASGSAEWGQPVAGTTLPLAIGSCEFDEFPPAEDEAGATRILVQYNTTARAGCDETYAPGGFGWLAASDCRATLSLIAGAIWHVGDRGNNPAKSDCDVGADIAPLLDTTVLIPIYDSFKKVGTSCTEPVDTAGGIICLHISKFAAFKLTGFKLGGGPAATYIDPAAPPCSGSCRGLQGFFLKYVSVDDAFELGDGDPDGLSVVRLIITDDELANLLD